MATEKNVLVLFYDQKDRERMVGSSTLEDAIAHGFEGTEVGYAIRTASPRHEPWLVLEYANEAKYDGIIVVAGMSCSLDIPSMLMEQLYDNERVPIRPRDWQNATLGDKIVSINDTIESKYFQQQRPLPIIGVPTWDEYTDGIIAFGSMLMSSRPSGAGCVKINGGYQAAQNMARLLTTKWKDVKILTPDKFDLNIPKEQNKPGAILGYDICNLLDSDFKPYDDAKIEYGHDHILNYFSNLKTQNKEKADLDVLHVCVYNDFSELEKISKIASTVIAVYVPDQQRETFGINKFTQFANYASRGPDNVIHSRVGVGENATVLVAHALYAAHPKLQPSRFTSLRMKKSAGNITEFLALWNEKGRSFEVDPEDAEPDLSEL